MRSIVAVTVLLVITCLLPIHANVVQNAAKRLHGWKRQQQLTASEEHEHEHERIDVENGAQVRAKAKARVTYDDWSQAKYLSWTQGTAAVAWAPADGLTDLRTKFAAQCSGAVPAAPGKMSFRLTYDAGLAQRNLQRIRTATFLPYMNDDSNTPGGKYIKPYLLRLMGRTGVWTMSDDAKWDAGHICGHQIGGGDNYIDMSPLNYFPQHKSSNTGIYKHAEDMVYQILAGCGNGNVEVHTEFDYTEPVALAAPTSAHLVPTGGSYQIKPNKKCWETIFVWADNALAGKAAIGFGAYIQKFVWAAHKQNTMQPTFNWASGTGENKFWDASSEEVPNTKGMSNAAVLFDPKLSPKGFFAKDFNLRLLYAAWA